MKRIRSKVYAVIPAAGSGTRIGGDIKKQFLPLQHKPILIHTLQRFERCPDIDEIAVAVPESSIVEMEKILSQFRLHKVSKVIAGGAKRQDSVANVLLCLDLRDSDIVLIHDGVRPFIEQKRISHLVKMCKEHDAAVLAVQPKDTVRRSAGGGFFDSTWTGLHSGLSKRRRHFGLPSCFGLLKMPERIDFLLPMKRRSLSGWASKHVLSKEATITSRLRRRKTLNSAN